MKILPTLLSSCLLLLSIAAPAETLTLLPSADATIHENTEAANGAGELISGKTVSKGWRRALIRFDLSEIPAGSDIQTVTLSLFFNGKYGVMPSKVHRLTRAWGEGNELSTGGEGKRANPGSVTYSYAAFDTEAWETPGGDFTPLASGSAGEALEAGRLLYTGTGMVQDVQAWVDTPGSNFGWIIISNEVDIQTTLHFFSRESNEITQPQLIIEYTPGSGTELYGGYAVDGNGDIDTASLFGRLNVADAPQLWSYDYAMYLFMPESWISAGGAWAYLPAELNVDNPAPNDPSVFFGLSTEEDFDVNSGDGFLNWVNTGFKPWTYLYTTGSWAYINESFAAPSGIYIYLIK